MNPPKVDVCGQEAVDITTLIDLTEASCIPKLMDNMKNSNMTDMDMDMVDTMAVNCRYTIITINFDFEFCS